MNFDLSLFEDLSFGIKLRDLKTKKNFKAKIAIKTPLGLSYWLTRLVPKRNKSIIDERS